MNFKIPKSLPRLILQVGLAVIAATFLYIFFYSVDAVDSGRLSRLDLVGPMIEHTVVALILLIGGVLLLHRFLNDGENH
ncbi:MAG: hypothetical protein IJC50_04255 [Clostridia bacterium]|nr:hypothetical protein [Clostridia bacterium]